MTINDITTILSKKQNGAFIKVDYKSDVALTAAAQKSGHTAFKVVTTTIRKGVNYANLKSTKEKLAKVDGSAEYAKVIKPLSWGEYTKGHEGLIIQHTPKSTGKLTYYLRAYTSPNKPRSQYFLDGKAVTREYLQNSGLVKDSYWTPNKSDGVMNIKVENIIHIY